MQLNTVACLMLWNMFQKDTECSSSLLWAWQNRYVWLLCTRDGISKRFGWRWLIAVHCMISSKFPVHFNLLFSVASILLSCVSPGRVRVSQAQRAFLIEMPGFFVKIRWCWSVGCKYYSFWTWVRPDDDTDDDEYGSCDNDDDDDNDSDGGTDRTRYNVS